MRPTFAEEKLEEPISQVRVKPQCLIYPVCPFCKRENGKAYHKPSQVWYEKIECVPHKNVFDCLKSVMTYANYRYSLPLSIAEQPIPGPFLYLKNLFINRVRSVCGLSS